MCHYAQASGTLGGVSVVVWACFGSDVVKIGLENGHGNMVAIEPSCEQVFGLREIEIGNRKVVLGPKDNGRLMALVRKAKVKSWWNSLRAQAFRLSLTASS